MFKIRRQTGLPRPGDQPIRSHSVANIRAAVRLRKFFSKKISIILFRMARKITILLLLALSFNVLVLTIIWIYHNMVTGLNPFLAPIFALLQLLLLAAAVWVGGRYIMGHLRKFITFSPATLFLMGAMILATTNLVDELIFGHSLLAYPKSSSYISDIRLIAHLLFALLFLVLAGAYHFFPVIAHRTLNPTLAYIHFWITLLCAYVLAYPVSRPHPNFNAFTHNTALILLAAQGLFLVNLLNSPRPSQ
jgi:hypothetical protein